MSFLDRNCLSMLGLSPLCYFLIFPPPLGYRDTQEAALADLQNVLARRYFVILVGDSFRVKRNGACIDEFSCLTIGIGEDVNSDFLKRLASSLEDYHFAKASFELKRIYKEVASDLLKLPEK